MSKDNKGLKPNKIKKKRSNGLFDRLLKIKMPKGYDSFVHAAIISLMVFGSIMVISTSVGDSAGDKYAVIKTMVKQVVFVLTSYILMSKFAIGFIKPRRRSDGTLTKFEHNVRIVGVIIGIMLLASQAFSGANGSKAWIYLPGINVSLQPSEFAKTYLIVLFGLTVKHFSDLTRYYNEHGREIYITFIRFMKEPLFFGILYVVLIAIQPDLGTIFVLGFIMAVIALIPTSPSLKKNADGN